MQVQLQPDGTHEACLWVMCRLDQGGRGCSPLCDGLYYVCVAVGATVSTVVGAASAKEFVYSSKMQKIFLTE